MHANELVVCLAFKTGEYLGLKPTKGFPFFETSNQSSTVVPYSCATFVHAIFAAM